MTVAPTRPVGLGWWAYRHPAIDGGVEWTMKQQCGFALPDDEEEDADEERMLECHHDLSREVQRLLLTGVDVEWTTKCVKCWE